MTKTLVLCACAAHCTPLSATPHLPVVSILCLCMRCPSLRVMSASRTRRASTFGADTCIPSRSIITTARRRSASGSCDCDRDVEMK